MPGASRDRGVIAAARGLGEVLAVIETRLKSLARRLAQRLVDEAGELDTSMRGRLEAVVRSLMVRTETVLPAWRSMLKSLEEATPPGFVDWLAIERGPRGGDIGMHRHYLDPTDPLARTLYKPAHGVLVTSATLFDTFDADRGDSNHPSPDRSAITLSPPAGRAKGEGHDRTGASHLETAPPALRFPSPFPYAQSTRFIVVRDVERRATWTSSRRRCAFCSRPRAAVRSGFSPRSVACARCTSASPCRSRARHAALCPACR